MSDSLVSIPDYYIIRKDRATRGGGICWYVNVHLKVTTLEIESLEEDRLEQLWIKINHNKIKYAFGVIYRPPDSTVSLEDLDTSLCQVTLAADHVILVGDLNINLLKNSTQSSNLLNMLDTYNLKQIIESPTRITTDSHTLIDIICLPKTFDFCNCNIYDTFGMSDHLMTSCTLNLPIIKTKPKTIIYKDYSSLNMSALARDAIRIDWNVVYENNSVDEQVAFFTSAVKALIELHIPEKTLIIRKQKLPYITNTIMEMVKLKHKAHTRYLKSKNPSHLNYYRQLRNLTSEAIKREKEAYIKKEINNNKKNPKILWKNLKKLNIHQNQTPTIPEDLATPDELNEFYTHANISSSINDQLLQFYRTHVKLENTDTFNFTTVSEESVAKAFQTLSSNAAGADDLNLKIWKLILPYCLPALTYIINTSLTTGAVPKIWKTAKITPIPKNSKPSNVSDLRPISILPIASKILEKIVLTQVNEFVNKNILPLEQSGFRKNHSTATTLLKVSNDVATAMDKSLVTILVLLDYSKAFDAINHDLLLAKLQYYGFNRTTISWFKNYLSDRVQYVQLNDVSSSLLDVQRGVPQGSILGPLLFTIFTSDLPSMLHHCSVQLYADDTQLYLSMPPSEVNQFVSEINNDLSVISEWSQNNGLLLNPEKTVAMCLGSKQLCAKAMSQLNQKIILNGKEIQFEDYAKNLGVIFDSNFNFEKHITKLCSNAYLKLKMIYNLKNSLCSDVKWKLCQSLILSGFNYCNCVYFNFANKSTQYKIQKVQNICLRFSFNIRRRSHVTPFYVNLNILKYEYVVYKQLATIIFNLVNKKLPIFLYLLLEFRYSSHTINVRQNCLMSIPYHRTTKFENSFQYIAVKIFNQNPVFFKLSLQSFKTHMFDFLINFQAQTLL